MYYILNEKIALRSWWLVPYAYYVKHGEMALGLKKEEFELLSLCDGRHDIEEDELTKSLVERRMISPVEKGGAELTEWQKPQQAESSKMQGYSTIHVMIATIIILINNCEKTAVNRK